MENSRTFARMHQTSDTIVALATPPGQGAIAVIRMSGPDATRIISECTKFRNGKKPLPTSWKANTAKVMQLWENDEIVDESVVTFFRGPHSFTGQDSIEIACHGSLYIQQRLLQLLVRLGARMAQRGEFTLRAFLNGKMDLSQAEAVADVVTGNSRMAHRSAMLQLRGSFSALIRTFREQLVHFASLIELELDFSEEDVEFANRTELHNMLEQMLDAMRRLLDGFESGNAIRHGITVSIVGRPNAGKSTLLNALVGDERAIVSDIPGTTRDTIEDLLMYKGTLFRFIDTAGIRESSDKIEQLGITRALQSATRSLAVIYLYDAGSLKEEDIQSDLRNLRERISGHLLVVANKVDKVISTAMHQVDKERVWISARENTNIDALKERLWELVSAEDLSTETPMLTNARHAEALRHAHTQVSKAMDGLQSGLTGELLAFEIREAIRQLGEITGEVTTDDLLENIFSKFCIGK